MASKATIDYSIKDIDKLVNFDGTIKNVEVSRLTAPGENYISLVLKVDFEVQKNGNSKTISSVAKRLPLIQNGPFFDMNKSAMKNEIKWYAEIVPQLKKFAKEQDIILDFYPEHYGSRYSSNLTKRDIDNDAVLILENLIPQGYQNNDRYIGCDLITSTAILKSLALFHALPIIIKIKKPELFQVLNKYLEDCRSKPPSGPDGHKGPPGPPPGQPRPEELLLAKLVDIPDFAPYISKIKPLLEKPRGGPEEFNKKTKEPWNTITHNDFWVNNVMIKYTQEKEPLVKLVDFQMCGYGTFVSDLVFFLLSSVRNDVTRESMDDLLRLYYDEFTSILKKGNANLDFTYKDFLEEVRENAQFEVLHAITFSTIIFGEKGTGVDVAVEEFDMGHQMNHMLDNMNQQQKDKLVVMASEAIKRNWL